jgi:hypothetical protein
VANTKHKRALEPSALLQLPFLVTGQVCVLGDCAPSTVRRSQLRPIGKRGKSRVYATSDVIRWLAGEPEKVAQPTGLVPRRSSSSTSDALVRIAAIAKGEVKP